MSEEKFPRRVPALVTYLEPFQIVEGADREPWACSIENVNRRTWDYAKLHEIVGGLDVGLPAPYHLLVAHDGALALPPIETLRGDQEAVEFFNRCLAALLLGGIFCRSITLDNLQFGSVIDWKYLRTHSPSQTSAGGLHDRLRMKQASAAEAIVLYKPRTVTIEALSTAMATGLAALKRVPELSAEFLLKGTTGLARRDWGTALSNLWIVVEQLTHHLWLRDVIEPERREKQRIAGRKDQLADTRTWTISARHELLHHKGTIDNELLGFLSVARKARNELSHVGKHPNEEAGNAAFASIRGLMMAALGSEPPLFALGLENHVISDPFRPIDRGPLDPEFWMEIPKLPGEAELEREEASARISKSEEGAAQ